MQATSPKVRMVGFRKLTGQNDPKPTLRRYGIQEAHVHVVLVDIGGSETEKNKLAECEKWVRSQEKVQLWKVTKSEAFHQTYLEMMKQSCPVYFVSLQPLEQLHEEPLLNTYKILLESKDAKLNEVHEVAKDNINKIRFIILKDNISTLQKQNYFHAGVALITTEPSLVISHLQQHIGSNINLKSMESSSSINTEQMNKFNEKFQNNIGEGVHIGSPLKESYAGPEAEAWKVKNDTPGVGTYDLTKFPK